MIVSQKATSASVGSPVNIVAIASGVIEMPATSDRWPHTASKFLPGAEKNTSPACKPRPHDAERPSLPSSMQIVRFVVPRIPQLRSGREKSVLLKARVGKIALVSEPLSWPRPSWTISTSASAIGCRK